MINILVTFLLLLLGAIGWVQVTLRKVIPFKFLKVENCATWAMDNFDYWNGDGVMLIRTVTDSWFTHVVIVKGARCRTRETLEIWEYVPVVRADKLFLPKWWFVGKIVVKKYTLVSTVEHPTLSE